MQKQMRHRQQAGFTLIELMIVIAIIGILAAMAIPQLSAYREKAVITDATNTGRQILNALTAYAATSEGNRYPADITTIEELRDVVAEQGLFLTDKQLDVFRDRATGQIDVVGVCVCVTFRPLRIRLCPWGPPAQNQSTGEIIGPERLSLLIPIKSIERPEDQTLVLEVNTVEGVKIHTGMPEITP